jgi:CheY-like chemotaxis protein
VNGLQDFLTPFSHLIFANRDKVIVLLAGLLAWFTVQLLVTRWRNERLERDLHAAKNAAPTGGGRRYASSAPVVEEAPAEGGVLPPVKGGRTYARNLGTALQKAGMAGQQIYSPPTPAGWTPQSSPQPQQPGPYAAPNVPWSAQPPAQSPPWGYPPAGPRTIPGPPPGQVPFYQPQSAPSPSGQPAPPPGPPAYGPPSPSFSPPTFAVPMSPSAAQGQPPASVPGQGFPSVSPGMPAPPQFGPAGTNPADAGGEAGRRGKPKRRRFNFNVLENLEKMVQRPAEPAPATGWTPPAPSSANPAPPAPAAGPGVPASTPALTPTWSPQPPPAGTTMPPKDQPAEESLPLPFGQGASAPPPPPTLASAESSLFGATPAETEQEPEKAEPASYEPERASTEEPTPVESAAPRSDGRDSMRSMMFGEEAQAAPQPEEAIESAAPAEQRDTESTSDASAWPGQPWSRSEESAAVEAESPAPQPEAEAEVEDAVQPEPVSETVASSRFSAYEPWKPAESEADSEAAAVAGAAATEAAGSETPDSPASENGGKPGAGTIVIIEDDQVAASYYSTLFKGNGYHVEVANDGVSGVDLCARMQPQVILLDVMMPRQNGILVLQTLRASDETRNTPVVVMSNFSEPTLIKRALQLGALEYVIKTQVEGPALLNALPRWMNREKAFAAA